MGGKKASLTVEAKTKSLKPGLKCVGTICFNDDGSFDVTIPKDADPECARRTVEAILAGKRVNYIVEGKEPEKE